MVFCIGQKNCGLRCGYYTSMGHMEDWCWKKGKEIKPHFVTNNYLEVLVNDKATTLEQLLWNKTWYFFGCQNTKKVIALVEMQTLNAEEAWEVTTDVRLVSTIRARFSKSKIFTHFFKWKISSSLMETILSIPRKLEYLEILVKLT